MALDFPNSPSVGQTFSSGSRTWTYTGSVWNLVGGPSTHASTHTAGGLDPITIAQSQVTGLTGALDGKASIAHTHAQSDVTGLSTTLSAKADRTSGTSFPASPTTGQIHVHTTTKCAYIYNGSQWIEFARPNAIEPLLLIGI